MTAIALRKSITIPEEENRIIMDYSKKVGKSFSEVLRIAAIEYIRKEEEQGLKAFLDAHCDYVDEEEQKELEQLIADTDINDEGKEIAINELLRG
ncbi:MAG: hypothetical protein Q4E64_01060 [Phascolarctobacterium sp.]|uniref:hypothetical protein n=1 Tax=Phascolarctobacterium sp. TaxID=2049039 RepID=UPI0026DD865D|nr:hypothetical protein [Phascolarctobacterium sp.]MDO4920407.1 hypothetical protein [Phascolarctobacterium sp.]